MEKETSSKKAPEKKLMAKMLKMLEVQAGESLKQARKRLSKINVENTEAREGLALYADNWNDLIHPSILSLSSETLSMKSPLITDLQIMVLLMTAAMDIHDDVLDKSTTKNGRATLFGKFGEDLAILLGDALLMESLIMLPSFRNSIDPQSFDRLIVTVKNTLLQVGDAHLMELKLKKSVNVLPKDVLNLIEKKAAIFDGIAEIGAIAGKASRDQTRVLKDSARSFGFLVMIREEFIDMFESDELSNRLKNEYPPLPILYAIEDLKVKEYVAALRSRKITEKEVQELITLVYKNQNVVKLKKTISNIALKTIKSLENSSLKKETLSSLASLIRVTLEDI